MVQATGIAASTIQRGLRELASGNPLPDTRTRKAGGGRKRTTDLDTTLLRDLDALVEPTAHSDPDSPLRWTGLSTRTLAVALEALLEAVVVNNGVAGASLIDSDVVLHGGERTPDRHHSAGLD